MPGNVPDRWENYTPFQGPIKGTRFIAFKVPLERGICQRLNDKEMWFTPEILVEQFQMQNLELGLVIDLTNTNRYYQPKTFNQHGIEHVKLNTKGHAVPSTSIQLRFQSVINEFMEQNRDNNRLVGVHCTHGVNRTGFLICRYMIDNLNVSPEDAIKAFNEARGYNIERENYLDSLRGIAPQNDEEPRGRNPSDREPFSGPPHRRASWEDRNNGPPAGRSHRSASREGSSNGPSAGWSHRDVPPTGRSHRDASWDVPPTGRSHRDASWDVPATGRSHRDASWDDPPVGRSHRRASREGSNNEPPAGRSHRGASWEGPAYPSRHAGGSAPAPAPWSSHVPPTRGYHPAPPPSGPPPPGPSPPGPWGNGNRRQDAARPDINGSWRRGGGGAGWSLEQDSRPGDSYGSFGHRHQDSYRPPRGGDRGSSGYEHSYPPKRADRYGGGGGRDGGGGGRGGWGRDGEGGWGGGGGRGRGGIGRNDRCSSDRHWRDNPDTESPPVRSSRERQPATCDREYQPKDSTGRQSDGVYGERDQTYHTTH